MAVVFSSTEADRFSMILSLKRFSFSRDERFFLSSAL